MSDRRWKRRLGPFYHLFIMGYLVARYPDSLPYLPAWLASLLPGHDTVRDRVPWIPFKARAWLAHHLTRDMSVFEYGSGGSTLFFTERVSRCVSVEHDPQWYERLRRTLAEANLGRCEYLLVEPEPATEHPSQAAALEYVSSKSEYGGMSFEAYARAIDRYPAGAFDLVMVDGRSRSACLLHAAAAARVGGYVLLDNSNNPEYAQAMRLLDRYPRTDLRGIGPYRPPSSWQTTVWRKTSRWADPVAPLATAQDARART